MTDMKMIEISVVTETENVAHPVFPTRSNAPIGQSIGAFFGGGGGSGYKTVVKKSVYGPFDYIEVFGSVVVARKDRWSNEAQAVIQLPPGASYFIRDASPDEDLVHLVTTMSAEQLGMLRNFIKTAM